MSVVADVHVWGQLLLEDSAPAKALAEPLKALPVQVSPAFLPRLLARFALSLPLVLSLPLSLTLSCHCSAARP